MRFHHWQILKLYIHQILTIVIIIIIILMKYILQILQTLTTVITHINQSTIEISTIIMVNIVLKT